MEELYERIIKIPDCYFGFVMGIIAYAKKDPNHIRMLMDYLSSSESLTTSDVLEFIVSQQDFYKYIVN